MNLLYAPMMIFGGWIVIQAGYYTCLLCNEQFALEWEVRQHCHEADGHWWCGLCSQLFDSRMALGHHTADSPSHHVCDFCPYPTWFFDEEDLGYHWDLAHFLCRECDVDCESQELLNDHNLRYHCGCHICYRPFENIQAREGHLRSHEPHNYLCGRCSRSFFRFSHYLAHVEASCGSQDHIIELLQGAYNGGSVLSHPNRRKRFHCPSCFREFRRLSNVYAHAEDSEECRHQMTYGNYLYELIIYLQGRM
ncbi:hypothetical protein N7492_003532 [Penicillium capsulatum]|uniref:C2H2-type domain-containing protein n=1 Tax=Penicillium capsulatum TaxID=69766 RepID=A0A9W9LXI7_9EURO|nr:hypothetical protein N7492_003532 [Penicillium capsulatum]KAJ6121884.1 hypothetical protein N7512_004349 [Penicillium capsulatum]